MMLNQLKISLRQWVNKQADKPRCGILIFILPKGFPFTKCCASHDSAYEAAREHAIKEVVNAKFENPDLQDSEIMKILLSYKSEISTADYYFNRCMVDMCNNSSSMFKPMLTKLQKMFISIVRKNGKSVWLLGTLQALKDMGIYNGQD